MLNEKQKDSLGHGLLVAVPLSIVTIFSFAYVIFTPDSVKSSNSNRRSTKSASRNVQHIQDQTLPQLTPITSDNASDQPDQTASPQPFTTMNPVLQPAKQNNSSNGQSSDSNSSSQSGRGLLQLPKSLINQLNHSDR